MSAAAAEPPRPAYVGLITDAAHVPQVRAQVNTLWPRDTTINAMLDALTKAGVCHLIVVIPCDGVSTVSAFVADGPLSLKRQMGRAVRSVKGQRTAWIRGLDADDMRITNSLITEVCQTVETVMTLADVEPMGAA